MNALVQRLVVAGLIGLPALPLPAETIRIESAIELRGQLAHPFDVRWTGDNVVDLALGRGGVVRCALDAIERCSTVIAPPGGIPATPTFFFTSRLAESERFVVAASPFRGFAYLSRATRVLREATFDVIVDADVRGSRVALLGARRDSAGTWAPEGAIAWIGSMDLDLRDLKPVTYSTSGGGARTMAFCHFLDDGVVRYLASGNLFVFPGVEPGAFLYDQNGRLIRAWPTEHLGVLDHCSLSQPQSAKLAADFAVRSEWLNRYRTADDAIDLEDGPALIVRASGKSGTTWSLMQFRWDGKTREVPLAITSTSPYAHINVDRRGSRLVFLVRDSEIASRRLVPPRLVIGSVQP